MADTHNLLTPPASPLTPPPTPPSVAQGANINDDPQSPEIQPAEPNVRDGEDTRVRFSFADPKQSSGGVPTDFKVYKIISIRGSEEGRMELVVSTDLDACLRNCKATTIKAIEQLGKDVHQHQSSGNLVKQGTAKSIFPKGCISVSGDLTCPHGISGSDCSKYCIMNYNKSGVSER